MTASEPRLMHAGEETALVELWFYAWHEAHDLHVPPELIDFRTRAFFARRIAGMGGSMRVAGPSGTPLGFCAIEGNEIDQLFTAPAARGSGLAQRLIGDGEERIKIAGHAVATLSVLPENLAAIRFYGKCGWRELGIETDDLKTDAGPYTLPVLRMEKRL
ncbi:MAG: GNAT family N-acetyltransferase [Pseudomonadota bacterium]